jgi:glucose-6-phosphate dehydrogenase assembly protein OpcA
MREITPPERHEGEHPPPRASVLNLVVHTGDPAAATRAARTVAQLSGLHPSRTLIIVSQPAAGETSLDASVSAHCQVRPDAHDMVCFEQVLLWAKGDTARHLASIVVPLLIPDLPVFLWWLGPPPQAEESLLGVCHRLIVASTDFQEPLPQLGALSRLISQHVSHERAPALSDFTWARLTPWRELIAQFFDGPELLPLLNHVHQVRIEYATDPGGTTHTAQALLLTSWLAARLNWRPEAVSARAHAREYRLTFYRDQEPVEVQIVPRARSGEPGAVGELLSVELTAAHPDQEASFIVARTSDGEHATTRARLPGLREVVRTVPLERPAHLDLLRGELSILKHDPAFEESLAVTARLLL